MLREVDYAFPMVLGVKKSQEMMLPAMEVTEKLKTPPNTPAGYAMIGFIDVQTTVSIIGLKDSSETFSHWGFLHFFSDGGLRMIQTMTARLDSE